MTRTKHSTGLDAAGPAFEGTDCKVRFCKSDAIFTETIHTNGHPKKGYGTSDKDGMNKPSYGEVWVKETVINVWVMKESD
jgi:hypothetical protein